VVRHLALTHRTDLAEVWLHAFGEDSRLAFRRVGTSGKPDFTSEA
jgi:hypothetical protein